MSNELLCDVLVVPGVRPDANCNLAYLRHYVRVCFFFFFSYISECKRSASVAVACAPNDSNAERILISLLLHQRVCFLFSTYTRSIPLSFRIICTLMPFAINHTSTPPLVSFSYCVDFFVIFCLFVVCFVSSATTRRQWAGASFTN